MTNGIEYDSMCPCMGRGLLYARITNMRKLIIVVLALVILAGLTGCHNWHYAGNVGFGLGHSYGYGYGYGNHRGGHQGGHGGHGGQGSHH